MNLIDSSGVVVRSTVTSVTGGFRFATDQMSDGWYRLQFVLPDDLTATTRWAGDPNKDSDLNPLSGATDPFFVTANVNSLNQDAGAQVAGKLAMTLQASEGKPVLRTDGGIFRWDRITVDAQGNYSLKLLGRNKNNPNLVAAEISPGVNVFFDYTKVGAGYFWGLGMDGNYYERGEAVANPPPSTRYYWAQYIRADFEENKAGAHDAMFGTRQPGSSAPPVDGKWYIDATRQWEAGMQDTHRNQLLNVNHPIWDLTGLTYTTNYAKAPAIVNGFLVWKPAGTAEQVELRP